MKVFTKWILTFALLCIAGVINATEYELDQKFTSLAELDGKSFAIVNETASTAMGIGIPNHGNGWDMYFGSYAEAYASNACFYKIEAAQGEGLESYYYLRTYKSENGFQYSDIRQQIFGNARKIERNRKIAYAVCEYVVIQNIFPGNASRLIYKVFCLLFDIGYLKKRYAR